MPSWRFVRASSAVRRSQLPGFASAGDVAGHDLNLRMAVLAGHPRDVSLDP